jgi:ligand-binding SRPBCC domain-containing protein
VSPGSVEVASRLAAPAAVVWERVTTFDGINDELMPLMRMTAPPERRALRPEDITPGERLFRSWILLGGVLPFDYDDITLVELEPGRGFSERSTMASMRLWAHDRRIVPEGEDGCTLTDRLRFEPRLPVPGRSLEPVVRAVYRHRHRRLRRRFGGAPA